MQKAFIFIGNSGSGKGTQANLIENFLKENYKIPVLNIETGDAFRDFIKKDGFVNKESAKIYSNASRQPDFLACYMWTSLILKNYKGNQHIIFDGAARSLIEAEMLDTALRFLNFKDSVVIFLNVSREWSKKHLMSRGRFDDLDISKLEKRLDWFDEDVVPSIEYYRNNPSYLFFEIDGEQRIEKVHADIMVKVKDLFL